MLLVSLIHRFSPGSAFLRREGYKLIKRTGPNNWWVPAPAKALPITLQERLSIWNRIWFRHPRRRLKWLLGNSAQRP